MFHFGTSEKQCRVSLILFLTRVSFFFSSLLFVNKRLFVRVSLLEAFIMHDEGAKRFHKFIKFCAHFLWWICLENNKIILFAYIFLLAVPIITWN